METKSKRPVLGCVLLLLCAFFWGSTFVVQSAATEKIQPLFYLAARSFIGAGALWLAILIRKLFSKNRAAASSPEFPNAPKPTKKQTLVGGLVCGAVITVASSLQQYGIAKGATAGQSGFLTAVYMFLVPLFAFVLYRKKISCNVFLGALFAFAGLYFLCIRGNRESAAFGTGQLLVLLCAVAYAVHIIVIDRFINIDGLYLSAIQFSVSAVLSLAASLLWEQPELSALADSWFEILYAGLFSTALAFTLQIFGQKYAPVTAASIVMSTESVVAFLSEWFCGAVGIFGENVEMNGWKIAGCVLAFTGILLSQLPPAKIKIGKPGH